MIYSKNRIPRLYSDKCLKKRVIVVQYDDFCKGINMIDLEDLHKTWSLIAKNRSLKNDTQVINFFRAVQNGKSIVKDISPEMLASLTEDDAEIVRRINLLFDMMAEAQKKAFDGIINNI